MHNKQLLFFITIIAIFFISISCRRDYSYEKSLIQKLQEQDAKGTLGSTTGQCATATINGEFLTNVETDASNTIQLTAIITKPGRYTITTDTVNGLFFNSSGLFYNAGTYNVTLQGHGTAINIGNTSFTVKFNQSQCRFTLPVLTDLNTWSFWDGSRKYHGVVGGGPGAIINVYNLTRTQDLYVEGYTDLTKAHVFFLVFDTETTGSFMQPGTHYLSDFPGKGFLFSEDFTPKYRIRKDTLNNFPLHIISFDQATGIMEATFEGSVVNIATNPINYLNIAKGRFKAQFRVTTI